MGLQVDPVTARIARGGGDARRADEALHVDLPLAGYDGDGTARVQPGSCRAARRSRSACRASRCPSSSGARKSSSRRRASVRRRPRARSPSPLLPLRIFRLRTLSAANATIAIVGAVAFSEFFLLTLYLQEVLHYSAIRSGLAFSAFALTVVVASNLAQALVGRVGVRATLTGGLVLSAVSVGLLTRLPVHGHYLSDLLPAFVLGGAGMGLSFVPVTIASLAGVDRADAGVASGLVNTSRQIGGAIGLAAVSTIAASATGRYAHAHAVPAAGGLALDHGFQTALTALVALLLVAILVAVALVRAAPPRPRAERVEGEPVALEEAA